MGSIFAKRRSFPPAWWLVPIAAGFLIGLGVAYALSSPRILAHSPPSGGLTGGHAAIEVEFSVPMDPACAEAHILLEPEIAVRMEWQGATLRIRPVNPWPACQAVRLTVQPGACSARGLTLPSASTWSFTASGPRITYVIHTDGAYHLEAVDAAGGDPAVLLSTEEPIQDYDISPQGEFIVYSTGFSDSASNLWVLALDNSVSELLLDCAGDACRHPAISPDGSSLAFQRSPMEASKSGGPIPLRPHVEIFQLQDRTVTRVSPDDHIADNPTWTQTGLLSYYDSTNRVIVVDDLHGGRTFIPDVSGDAWSWFPDARKVIFPEAEVAQESDQGGEQPLNIYSRLYLIALSENKRTNLSGDSKLQDSSPAISPDSLRLAFTREYLDNRWTPGRQLWLMDLETLAVTPITNIPEYGHSSLQWSPDGSALAFMRYHETAPYDPPEVWRIDSNGGNARRIAVGGYLPQWLP